MIVRDAEATIERCIRSALPIIDNYLIIDTGSTDRTIKVAKETLEGTPGHFLNSEWVGHAHNRTVLLTATRGAGDYTLMLDADMELKIDGDLPELTMPAYLLRILDRGMEYPLPLLTHNRYDWYYAGVAHAYLASRQPTADPVLLPQLSIIDHGGGGNRPGKIERDRDLLADAVAKDPLDRRSWFYLAQSYRDLDAVPEAIACYRMRASLGGWDEEVYNALYQAGVLLCEHVSYAQGAKLLLEAWELMPGRAEALRALAGSTTSVADKIPFPENDVLFVRRSAYKTEPAPPLRTMEVVKPSKPPENPSIKRLPRKLLPKNVSAVIPTRGNVDMAPILELLPYKDIVVWDNSVREDLKTLARFRALDECKHDIVYFQDDDVLFTEHMQLLSLYEAGLIVCNMNPAWVQACGYDDLAMTGAGAVADRDLFQPALDEYLKDWPDDDLFRMEADFVIGTIVPHRKVDLGYTAREFANDPDRLYTQTWQPEWKQRARERARTTRDRIQAERLTIRGKLLPPPAPTPLPPMTRR